MHNLYVHASLVLALPLSAMVLLIMLKVAPTDGDWKALAITFPIVWVGSLMIRVLSQWLAIGWQGDHFELAIGPLGNLSQDYERLSAPTMMFYAAAGQAATLMVAFVGVFILGLNNTGPESGVTAATLLDFHTGYSANAWTSQIVWVNGLLFVVHLLPALPLDARAFFIGWCRATNPAVDCADIHRWLASTNSHMGIGLAGVSIAMAITAVSSGDPIFLWLFLIVVSSYLLGVSQFEASQAQHEAELAEALPVRAQRPRRVGQRRTYDELDEYDQLLDVPSPHEILDIDEILRKLHREGQQSLSPYEKEALLSASRELQARRQPRS